jgi:DNA-binding MarR family transcriptional regulator
LSAERRRLAAECHKAAHEVFASVNRNVGAELLQLDLPMGQFKAIATITMLGPQPVGELGRRLGISEPAASLLVGKLEERGLAARVRDEEDRRRILVTATEAGDELAARLRQGREEQVQQWLGQLSDDELRGLLLGFRGLLRVVRAERARDGAGDGEPAGAAHPPKPEAVTRG